MEHLPLLKEKLTRHGQEHVLTWWHELSANQQGTLKRQVEGIDLEELARLYQQRDQKIALPTPERVAPLPRPQIDKDTAHFQKLGQEAFRAGQVGFLVVAGGQGTRLGFDHPKGMFPIGPVSNKSLFQIHAEKILALRRRYQAALPFLVMTSPATHDETVAYFQEHECFGLPEKETWFFQQGTMPALDLATGKLLMEAKDRLFVSPNGHGGTLTGLADSGLLDRLEQRGIRIVYYFQVDNPLVNLADTVFIGRHVAEQAEVSSKVLAKSHPLEKVGNFALIDGRCGMIEYSDLPEELARQTDEQGQLRLWAANPAIQLFDVGFLRQITSVAERMPWHLARKKVPYINESGHVVEPVKENALKFERFIFDVLPQSLRWTVMETTRAEEFEPLKNATGADSPETVKAAISNQARRWLEQAGLVDLRSQGPFEISPLYALDAEELSSKGKTDLPLNGPVYLDTSPRR